MNNEMRETLMTNWNLHFIKRNNTERYELTTLSGEQNLRFLMYLLEKGFEYGKVIDKNWEIILERNQNNYLIRSVNDIHKDILEEKFKSFLPEKDFYRPTPKFFKDDKNIPKDTISQISSDLFTDKYIEDLKVIIGKVFNIDIKTFQLD